MDHNSIHRIAIVDDYQSVALTMADWKSLPVAETVSFSDHVELEAELAARLRGFDIVVAMRERSHFRRSLLEQLVDVRLLVTTGRINAAIDLDAAAACGITVCGTGASLNGTPELTWALILAAARNIVREDAAVRAGRWQTAVGADLAGATLGLLGLGVIGSAVAKVGLAFGMDVVAWSENLTADTAAMHGVRRVDKEVLFESSDVVSVHLVLSERTRGIVSQPELRRMKPTALLVNTSRGPLVDEGALVSALREGWIAGAGLDVFDHEPLSPDHPFCALPTVVLTPHIGYVTSDCYRVFFREAVEDVQAFLDGVPVRLVRSAPGLAE